MHARANSGSIGQGNLRARHCTKALKASMKNDSVKIKFLCSETHISAGKVDTNPTRVAPIPRETRSAGSAQQIKVLNEVNKLRKGTKIL